MSATTEKFEPIPLLKGECVSKAQLTELFGKTPTALDGMVRRGMPCERTGGVRSPLKFDTAQAIAWHRIDTIRREHGETVAKFVRLEIERDALFAEVMRLKERRARSKMNATI
jgi:phage terminase Nu1 subunit (DNA packaging protein)